VNIVVLNGSPKGLQSVTMQYVHYIQKKFPAHSLEIIDVSRKIGKIEHDRMAFDRIIDSVRTADGVLWAFPVYYLLVPSQYKRFIELVSEAGVRDAFTDKHAAVLTTSIHFIDHTAHAYMQAVCDDFGMRFTGSFSAEMDDLLDAGKRRMLELFAGNFFGDIENGSPAAQAYSPLQPREFRYEPTPPAVKVGMAGKRVLVLTDVREQTSNLARMVERFAQSFDGAVEVANIRDLDIKGGCLGCIQCSFDNRCVYDGRDGYRAFYEGTMKKADIIVMALTVVDRYVSAAFKQFTDRSFFNNHVPSLKGKHFGHLVSGPFSQIPDLGTMLRAFAEFNGTYVTGVVTDEFGDSPRIDSLLGDLARRLARDSAAGYAPPPTFMSVGGAKIFRDDIYGKMRFVFQADHAYYTANGLYDFPQKKYRVRALNAVLVPLLKVPFIRRQFKKKIKEGMIMPHQKVVKNR
jgi:multimeric flavodoxin WrbA